MSQAYDRLYIVIDSSLPTGLAAAQIAHVAVVAAQRWDISEGHYVVVLQYDDLLLFLDRLTGWCHRDGWLRNPPFSEGEYVYFCDPDLDNLHTAVAVLNPPPNTFSSLQLWKGGEKDGN